MARNRRKVYGETGGADGGEACRDCGCRHFYTVRTERIGAAVRTVRRCRNCGRETVADGPD